MFSRPQRRVVLAHALLLILAGSNLAGGNVSAFLNDSGDLMVVGDHEDNQIQLCTTECAPGNPGPPGGYTIWSTSNTTINGLPGLPGVVLVPTGTRFRILLNGGADFFRLDGFIPFEVDISGGPGDDFISLGVPRITKSLKIDTGLGSDFVEGEDSIVRQDFLLLTGMGVDQIDFRRFSVFGTFKIALGEDDDLAYLEEVSSTMLYLDGGKGADQIAASACSFVHDWILWGRDGADRVQITRASLGGDLNVFLGDQDDVLELGLCAGNGIALLHGGDERDKLKFGENMFAALKLLSFESVETVRPGIKGSASFR